MSVEAPRPEEQPEEERDEERFPIDPWEIRETELDVDALPNTESIFALANGHLGMRGTLDEGDPSVPGGTLLNGFHEQRPLPYAETAYGQPEVGETVVDVTDGKLIRLLVNDELFDVRYGELLEHERTLDFRTGILDRKVHWRSPSDREVRIHSQRLVSLSQRGAAAIRYEVEPVGRDARVVIQSELVANESEVADTGDPRAAAALDRPLEPEAQDVTGLRVMLVHRTRASELRMAAAMDHKIEGPDSFEATAEAEEDSGRVTIAVNLKLGEKLVVTKFLGYGWSSQRSISSVRAQVRGTVAEARHAGWDVFCQEQREYLDAFWAGADVELDGDDELQQAVRFSLFHVLQAGARSERRAIPAKGLTGSGYDGHAFWDTETFVLPVLTYTVPFAAGDALRWRLSTMDLARDRARQLGLRGAAFPWRTITGGECSGYWPAGTAAFHVGADIADAAMRHARAIDDGGVFEREVALPLIVETARLWASLGHHNGDGKFHIAGVTGPDEYSAIADDNVFTNLMAMRNLHHAVQLCELHPDEAKALRVTKVERRDWSKAARTMYVPYDAELGLHPQAQNFLHHAVWDFEKTRPEQYPLLLHFPYFDLYRKQVVKQADLVLALYLCGHQFTAEERRRNFAYYESITVRDSSLSANTQAIVAAETGHLDLAYDYLGEAAFTDLLNLKSNSSSGLHVASLGGTWLALVAGFGGMRDHAGELHFSPRLPDVLTRMRFRINYRGRRLLVTVVHGKSTYELIGEEPLTIEHHGEELTLQPGEPVERETPIIDVPEPVSHPRGREPHSRRVQPDG